MSSPSAPSTSGTIYSRQSSSSEKVSASTPSGAKPKEEGATALPQSKTLPECKKPKKNPASRPKRVYDSNGIHIQTGIDLCDCLEITCVGCFYPCQKCRSQKCGTECRVRRRHMVEEIEYETADGVVTVKNPLM